MSMSPKQRERLERERQVLKGAADGLDKIVREVCRDGALCRRLDAIVDGRAIELLVGAAATLSCREAGIAFDLSHEDAS
jgi:hypothetical protein